MNPFLNHKHGKPQGFDKAFSYPHFLSSTLPKRMIQIFQKIEGILCCKLISSLLIPPQFTIFIMDICG